MGNTIKAWSPPSVLVNRRRLLGWGAAWTATSLVGCGPAKGESAPAAKVQLAPVQTGATMGYPWLRGIDTSYNFTGLALHPSGRTLAMNFRVGDPRDVDSRYRYLSLLDLATRRVRMIATPGDDLVVQPSYSSDGRYLAAASTPVPYFGISRIAVFRSSDGALLRMLGDPRRLHLTPSFSPDNRYVYCSIDYNGDIRREDSAEDGMALCRIEVETNRTEMLSRRAFAYMYKTGADPLGRGVYFQAADPEEPLEGAPRSDPPFMALSTSNYRDKYGLPRDYFLPFGSDLPVDPPPFATQDKVGRGARYEGVTSDGAVLINGSSDGAGGSKLYLIKSGTMEEIGSDVFISDASITPDGKTLAYGQWRYTGPQKPGLPTGLDRGQQLTIIQRRPFSREVIPTLAIDFAHARWSA